MIRCRLNSKLKRIQKRTCIAACNSYQMLKSPFLEHDMEPPISAFLIGKRLHRYIMQILIRKLLELEYPRA